MADRAKTIPELPVSTALNSTDLFVIVVDPTNTANTKQITASNVFGNSALDLSANSLILAERSTPANSSITVTKGSIFFDDSYIYVATANNTLKRIELTSF